MKSRAACQPGGALCVFWSLIFSLPSSISAATSQFSRSEFHVRTNDGFQIAVRKIKASNSEGTKKPPIILVHGARVPGIASFDLPVPGGSLAEDLAKAGVAAYVMDTRGYGGSTRSKAMDQPPNENRPLSRAYEVVRDILAVVREVRYRNSANQVALFGWADRRALVRDVHFAVSGDGKSLGPSEWLVRRIDRTSIARPWIFRRGSSAHRQIQ